MKIIIPVLVGFILLLQPTLHAKTYAGSSFNEVWDVVQDKNFKPQSDLEIQEFGIYQNNKLPQYPVNSKTLFTNADGELKKDALRTVSEHFDYYDRLAKKLHPNGVCVAGEWKINETTPYTGYFASFSRGLFIGRISVAMEDTTSENKRGFGLAGKIFPSLDPHKSVVTGNFFSIDVLLGTNLLHALDARTTNQPENGFSFGLLFLALKISDAFKSADENPSFRPLTQVASLGIEPQTIIKQPRWIRLSIDPKIKRNDQSDFRSEIINAFNDNSGLKYTIDVSDTTADRLSNTGWTTIGEINLNQVKVSYGCDRRLHFSHPKLKD